MLLRSKPGFACKASYSLQPKHSSPSNKHESHVIVSSESGMDSLVKQVRVRFGGAGEDNNTKERRVPIQKTFSFRGEKKKAHKWFQRQFSGQMNVNDIEHATAVAAVAYAINSLEESSRRKDKDGSQRETPLSNTHSNKEEDIAVATPRPVIAPRTSKGSRKSFDDFEVPDRKDQMASPRNDMKPDPGSSSYMERFPTDKKPLNNEKPGSALPEPYQESNTRPETAFPKPAQQSTKNPETFTAPKPVPKPTLQPSISPPEIRRMGTTKPATETKADSWERAQLAKIKARYERLNATIDSWESKKKAKAKHKLEKSEKETEKIRTRALQRYRSDMESIDQIAGGARAQALEKRRNDELKVKERANRIRSTGEIPSSSCLCF